MKKAFDQTVRDLKRGVNKNVLKVPSIEQKVLDATSNEPWGPHGSLLSDIAQATRNYHEYQIIMSVIWKRANDTGKNWRHVYKALTVLEYLVAHGSERVIDDIREHAYQISALSDFQYIDSRGKDQGNNVRKKSQSIVVLVNDKERIQEVRQKAAANRDKYRSTAVGSSSGGYGDRFEDDRYGNRDDDRNGYGRDRDWGSRDDGRDYEDRFGRDGYRDDDYRGRSQQNDEYSYNSRSRSVDRDRNSANEDDGRYSSRGSGGKGDDHSQDGSTRGENLDRKYSGQNLSAPPSYEEVVGTGRSPSYSDRDGEYSQPNAPKESNASDATQKGQPTTAGAPTPASPPVLDPATIPAPSPTSLPAPTTAPTLPSQNAVQHSQQEVGGFDAFDPRGPSSAASTTSGTAPTSGFEMDLLGSLSIVPVSQPTTSSETNDSASINSGPFEAAPPSSAITNQPFDDPFGDGPFTAVPTTGGASIQPQITHPPNSFSSNPSQGVDVHQTAPNATTEFAGAFNDASHSSLVPSGAQLHTSAHLFPTQELSAPKQEIDILAGILPPSESSSSIDRQGGYPVPPSQSVSGNGFTQTNQPASQSDLSSLTGYNAQQTIQAQTGHPASFLIQHSQPSSQANYHFPSAESVSQTGYPSQGILLTTVQAGQAPQFGFHSQTGSVQPNMPNYNFPGAYTSPSPAAQTAAAYTVPPSSTGTATMHSFPPQSSSMDPVTPQMVPQTPQARPSNLVSLSTHPSSAMPAAASQPTKDKFETKSSVWADTLSRGLVNLDISGSKANPLADIGVDFDSINRKEKRMEKPTTAAVISTVTMGKAMGSGSGRGQAGSSGLRPPQNQMMGSGMNMGMAGGPGAGFGMGGGYGVNQPMGRGMGMGMGMSMPGNMGVGMGMNMNMGPGMNMNMGPRMGPGMNMNMGPGMNMQQPMGFPPGSAMPGGYNHMVGPGYGQQPQGGGYR